MLKDEIKKRITAAMKEKRDAERDILRLAFGEIQTGEARAGKDLTDEEVSQIIRKLIKSNEETLAATAEATAKAVLAKENEILATLLPKALTTDEIVTHLGAVKDAIAAAGNDGQATGVAMKHLKTLGLTVPGNAVQAAIKALRAK
jgi:uncharacterized protein YqeY